MEEHVLQVWEVQGSIFDCAIIFSFVFSIEKLVQVYSLLALMDSIRNEFMNMIKVPYDVTIC